MREVPNFRRPLTYLKARGATGAELALQQQNAREVRNQTREDEG